MKNLIVILISAFALCACSTVRTKRTDPMMRVCVDPTDLGKGTHMRLQRALLASKEFQVVDRGQGVAFAKQEQEDETKEDAHRYPDAEKYAEWKKLYGCGSIVVANADCQSHFTWSHYEYFVCHEELTIVDASTGQVLAAAEDKSETEDAQPVPGWVDAVDKLIAAYPHTMINDNDPHQTVDYKGPLKAYREKLERAGADRVEGRDPASAEKTADKGSTQ